MSMLLEARIEALEEQNAALAAELVAVKAAADKMRFKGAIVSNICYNIGQSHSDAEQILQAVKEYDEEARKFRDASSLDPKYHLRQVRADAVSSLSLDCYDAGYLNDSGGGNVEWWQDYIRSELASAHFFYQSQVQQYASILAVKE